MQRRILRIGDLERSFSVYVPRAYDGTRTPIPLVLVLHGAGGNADQVARITGMSEIADKAPFIAVFPEGTARKEHGLLTWNAGNCCGYAYENQVDDVGFIRALVGSLSAEYRVDPKRVYAVGMSNGGILAYRLACELSDTFAAIGVVAGAFNVSPCRPTRPVALVIFHGTADEHVLYEGGVGGASRLFVYDVATASSTPLKARAGAGLFGYPTIACRADSDHETEGGPAAAEPALPAEETAE